MIYLNQLTKKFSNGKGIFDVSFEVKEGEVFGFIGPNGAGKSTTIRHLMGFVKPTSGSATIQNLDCWSEAASIQKIVGYLPGEIAFLEGMTGLQFLQLLGGMRQMKDSSFRDALIDRLQFDIKTPIRKMSKGMKQKVAIVATFMHDPEVLILDEPTSGLDPLMQKIFIDLVIEEKQKGKTILMSSHSFQEIERTCDRAGMIKNGKLLAVENIHDLQSKQRKVIEVSVASMADVQFIQTSGLRIISHDQLKVEIEIQGNYNELCQTLSKCDVTGMHTQEMKLEDIFMDFYDKGGEMK